LAGRVLASIRLISLRIDLFIGLDQ
jgi:hypothetical protein